MASESGGQQGDFPAKPEFVQVMHQIGRVLIDAKRSGALKLLLPVSA